MPDPDEKRPKHDERTTERRLVAAAVAVPEGNAPSPDAGGEDFLFHLYRGSELLQDGRAHDAKEELELALTLQPRDSKAMDLLAVAYFRIGLFPRAIQLYEQLRHVSPRDSSLKVNLALCYLRTGKAGAARTELEDVVRASPTHRRAWGYLGLAHERLGDLERALGAFERGGHAGMARRVSETLVSAARFAAVAGDGGELRDVAEAAYEDLDAGAVDFTLAAPSGPQEVESGTWKAVELGEVRLPAVVSSADGWTVPPGPVGRPVALPRIGAPAARNDSRESAPASARGAAALAEIARSSLLMFPRASGVSLHPTGVALVKTMHSDSSAHSFATRLESIRAQSSTVTIDVLQRQTRGKTSGESFGGLGSPMVRASGGGELVVGPRASHALSAFTLHDDTIFVREDVLLGFELSLQFDNQKLALGDGDSIPVVQLRGSGAVLLELMEKMVAVEVLESRSVLVRHEVVLGWTARVAPRAPTLADARGGNESQRGLLSFAGDGSVLLSAR